MIRPPVRAFFLAAVLAVGSPANAAKPEIVQLSGDIYLLTVQNKAGVFGSLPRTRQRAIQAANDFAQSRGMEAVPVAMQSTPAGGPGQWPTVEYQFRLLVPGSVPADGTALLPRADSTIDINVVSTGTSAVGSGPRRDIYLDLLKLDDLRGRGILTEDEFQREKRKLLAED